MLASVCEVLFVVVRLCVARFVKCSLAGVCCLLFAANRCDVFVGVCCLFVFLFVGCCSWLGVRCVLFVACCVLRVAVCGLCLLCVVRCVMCFA